MRMPNFSSTTHCYGDITPRTGLGHVFVIVVIIGIFTIVPAEVNKLNTLAKQSNPWDKEVVVKSSGHVIVSGYNLSANTVLEFLQEFYHPSRGSIHLDVVFVSDESPSSELLCILEKQNRTNVGVLKPTSDIGFIIARTASDVIRIVTSYGYWEGNSDGDQRASSSLITSSVRVSSDTLWRRRSPRHRFQPTTRSASVRNIRLELAADNQFERPAVMVEGTINETLSSSSSSFPASSGPPEQIKKAPPIRINRTLSMPSVVNSPSSGSSLYAAILLKDEQKIEAVFERDHYRSHVKGHSDHYVICSRSLSDAVSIATFLRRYARQENKCKMLNSERDHSADNVRIVFLLAYKPTAKDLLIAAGESSADLLRSVLVIAGSPARSNDLIRVEAAKARRLVILPLDKSISGEGDELASTYEVSEFGLRGQTSWTDDERMADFGVVCSLLAVEIMKQGLSGNISPRMRRHQSSRLESDSKASPTRATFKRELEQGLPLESVKLRAMGRFPGLDPGIFRENSDTIDAALQQHDNQPFQAHRRKPTASGALPSNQPQNTLSVLHYASNAKLCRPCDEAVQDEFPSLTPSFAGGSVFLASLLNRIVCQAFYNPYITDVIEALANGSGSIKSTKRLAGASREAPSSSNASGIPHRRLFNTDLEDEFVDGPFIDVFLDYISKEMLVIGIFRQTNSDLENLLPFVYTCPSPSTIMHSKDRLFVLG
ncbi:unnamed protein product [Phytophthora lilii]|uniref:Unnamed protein product n=1 Tax=Phytophthora lilii TaxID=2077276 RepID=A0A9W6TGG7_9STRA|nr:unnamed protein product [Phytophthora lilii]